MIRGTIEFRQLLMLGILSSVLSFVFSGLEVLNTLYALTELKISASEWSEIRAYRYILTIVIVVIMGTYAGKIGQKRIAAATIAFSAINLLIFVIHPTKLQLFIMLPFHAAFISMVTLSINVLVQDVPNRLQAISNTVYRSTFTGLAVLGPLTLALFADSNRMLLFLLFTIGLLLCFPGFIMFPSSPKSKEDTGRNHSFRDLMHEWRILLQNKHFILFEILVTTIYSSFLVNMIFGPIKLIQLLGLSDQQFSYTSTGVAFVTMILTLMAGLLFRKILAHLVYWPLFLCSLGNLFFGLQSNVTISIIIFIITNALNVLSFASVSIWTSRIVTKSQLGFAFTFHKIFISVSGFVFAILLSLLELNIGINNCMIIMGIIGCVFSFLLKKMMVIQKNKVGDLMMMDG